LDLEQLSGLYVKMVPALAQKVEDLQRRQQETYDALANYAERDELAHLKFDFSLDDAFVDFMNQQKLLDFDVDIELLKEIEKGKHFEGASEKVQRHQDLLAKYQEIKEIKPMKSGLDFDAFSETQKQFFVFLQERYSPKSPAADMYQEMLHSELTRPRARKTPDFYRHEIFEDEWQEIMNNMDIYAHYYFSNKDFRERFDDRLKKGKVSKIRGWTTEAKMKLEKLKSHLTNKEDQEKYADLYDKLSILSIEKHPLQEKLESKTLDWYPYAGSSPFTTRLMNHKTGQIRDINLKNLQESDSYFKDTVTYLAKCELDNYRFASNELSSFENIDERIKVKSMAAEYYHNLMTYIRNGVEVYHANKGLQRGDPEEWRPAEDSSDIDVILNMPEHTVDESSATIESSDISQQTEEEFANFTVEKAMALPKLAVADRNRLEVDYEVVDKLNYEDLK
jgi:hypothetical protein